MRKMIRKFTKFLKNAFFLSIVGYLLFCTAVIFRPEWFFYHPVQQASNIENARSNGYPAKQIEFTSADGTKLHAWYTPPQTDKPVIVFFHGNSYNIEKFYHKLIPLMEAGYGTFIPEYRGFGGVPGRITEKNLKADALAAVKRLTDNGFDNSKIVLYGMSLGSHMAVNSAYQLGYRKPFYGVILEVPFDTLPNVAKKVVKVPLPIDFLVKEKYDNLSMIKQLHAPLLVLGAEKDRIVPVELAKNLYQQAVSPKEIIIYEEADHSDLYSHNNYKDILIWLKKNEKVRP